VQSPLNAVVYHEAIGLGADRARATIDNVRAWCDRPFWEAGCQRGVSPHAPYTVGRDLFERLRPFREAGIPFATHLGETRDECEFLATGRGPFADFLTELGVFDPAAFVGLDEWLDDSRTTVVHANQLMFAAKALGKARGVVYCPRTFAAFGHRRYPLREFLEHGVNVALGTDSLASNPDLDVLAEARHVFREFPDVPPSAILAMITRNAALALSDEMVKRTGSLSPGKDATFTIVPLPDRDDADPHRLLFDSSELPSRTMIRGRWSV
jgi:cytosine/adenosine deaminase-related metal-dependent hydrolase